MPQRIRTKNTTALAIYGWTELNARCPWLLSSECNDKQCYLDTLWLCFKKCYKILIFILSLSLTKYLQNYLLHIQMNELMTNLSNASLEVKHIWNLNIKYVKCNNDIWIWSYRTHDIIYYFSIKSLFLDLKFF